MSKLFLKYKFTEREALPAQGTFLLLCQKSKWQKVSICKYESFLTFALENFLQFGYSKVNRNWFTDLVLIKFTLFKWQKVFHIKCQKEFTFANKQLLPFYLQFHFDILFFSVHWMVIQITWRLSKVMVVGPKLEWLVMVNKNSR